MGRITGYFFCLLTSTGTSERVFAQYIPQIDAALKEFSDRHWPCEFFVKGTLPPHLQTHLDNMSFQQSMRAVAVIMRCANTAQGHAKGHQLTDGRVFARGSYESTFSFEENRTQVLDDIYRWYNSFMERVTNLGSQGYGRLEAASAIHRDDVLVTYYTPTDKGTVTGTRHTTFCICCLFGTPEITLPCAHMLCRNCVVAYGNRQSHALVEIHECPLETNHDEPSRPRSVYLRPEAAGIRVLALNKYITQPQWIIATNSFSGGIRSIIQLEILTLIEKELGGRIPIQSFFDMIIGEGQVLISTIHHTIFD